MPSCEIFSSLSHPFKSMPIFYGAKCGEEGGCITSDLAVNDARTQDEEDAREGEENFLKGLHHSHKTKSGTSEKSFLEAALEEGLIMPASHYRRSPSQDPPGDPP